MYQKFSQISKTLGNIGFNDSGAFGENNFHFQFNINNNASVVGPITVDELRRTERSIDPTR